MAVTSGELYYDNLLVSDEFTPIAIPEPTTMGFAITFVVMSVLVRRRREGV